MVKAVVRAGKALIPCFIWLSVGVTELYHALVSRPSLKVIYSIVLILIAYVSFEISFQVIQSSRALRVEKDLLPAVKLESSAKPTNALTNEADVAQELHLKRETRALWSWAGVDAASRADIDRLVDQVDRANLNVILLGVYKRGLVAFEPSHVRFPDRQERLINRSVFEDDTYPDALSYLLAIRDERKRDDDPTNDFEVHPWFAVIYGGYQKNNLDRTEPDALNAIFPEFKLETGRYYRTGNKRAIKYDVSVIHQPKFRAYMRNLIAGMVEDYDVDGVHLDFIRTGGICFNDEMLDYPGTEYDYPGCQADYKNWTRRMYGQEYTLWEDTDAKQEEITDGGSGRVASWLEWPVNELVKSIHDETRSIKPEIIITVAAKGKPTTPEERKLWTQGQVAWEWLDNGWIDAIFLMNYKEDTRYVVDKAQRYVNAAQQKSSQNKIFLGLGAYDVPGGDRDQARTTALVDQINAALDEQGMEQLLTPPTRGIALFRDDGFSDRTIETLAEGPFKEPALPFWSD